MRVGMSSPLSILPYHGGVGYRVGSENQISGTTFYRNCRFSYLPILDAPIQSCPCESTFFSRRYDLALRLESILHNEISRLLIRSLSNYPYCPVALPMRNMMDGSLPLTFAKIPRNHHPLHQYQRSIEFQSFQSIFVWHH